VGQPDPAVGQFTQRTAGEDLADLGGVAVIQPGQRDDQLHVVLVGRRDDLLGFGDGRRQQLLGEDVLARPRGRHHHVPMPAGLGGDGHGVDVVPGQQGIKIIGEFDAEVLGAGGTTLGVVVVHGDELGVGVTFGGTGVVAGVHVPEAEHRNSEGCGHDRVDLVSVGLSGQCIDKLQALE
jgi:hypothetical protein